MNGATARPSPERGRRGQQLGLNSLPVLVAVVLGLAVSLEVLGAERLEIHKYNGDKPTAMELARLPRYCWGWYTNYKGPRYFIPKSQCGPGMNHYCGGLINKMRADDVSQPKSRRIAEYRKALKRIDYTLRWMEKYPACPLRKSATMNRLSVVARLQGLGAKPGR